MSSSSDIAEPIRISGLSSHKDDDDEYLYGKYLRLLNSNCDVNICDLDKHVNLGRAYHRVKKFIEIFYGTSDYERFSKILRETCKNKGRRYDSGTIGSFLYGCESGNDYCNPDCIGAIPSNGICNRKIWGINEVGELYLINSIGDSHDVDLYINDSNTLTPDMVKALRVKGVRNITLINGDKRESVTIDTLLDRLKGNTNTNNNNNTNANTDSNTNRLKPINPNGGGSSNLLIWLMGFAVLLIIIYFIYRWATQR